jgi:tRNA pseudouridine55 synthase
VPDGLVLVDKPAGRTSFSVTNETRRGLGLRKAGHAGTLDPFATGLLLVLVGRGRRVQGLLTGLEKTYETVARLGWTSTTGDPEGELVQTGRVPPEDLELPTGWIDQVPPAYSAVRIGGRRAYELAREGLPVEVPSRRVHVAEFEQLWREGDRAAFRIRCSAGTYVRSLVAALGDAYCVELRRTSVGPWPVERADPQVVLPLEEALAFLPHVVLDAGRARRAGFGQLVEADLPPGAERALLLDEAGAAVCVAEPREGGLVRPVIGFRG